MNIYVKFAHLNNVRQGYFQHMKDAFFYSIVCLKMSVLFFVHGLYPDAFEDTSIELSQLSTLIRSKKRDNNSDQI